MNKKLIISYALVTLLVLPVISLAQPGTLSVPITIVIANLLTVALTVLWIIATAFVIIMFVLAGFKYLTAQGDPNKVHEANRAVIWGFAGAAVIILAWSVIAVVRIQIGV